MNTTLKPLIYTLAALLLTACGGGSGSAPGAPATSITPTTTTVVTTPTGTASTAAPANLKAMIKALEDNGQLPKLDRSSDIKGPDVDNNGIRDDIDAWIAALPITAAQKKAAQQAARVQQATLLVDLSDKLALQAVGDRISASVRCIRLEFMPDYQKGFDLDSQIEAITANTKARAMQYIKYNRARSGSATTSPSGNTCEP
jgi:hypothetical protein